MIAGETPSLDKMVAEMYENAHKDLDKYEALLRVARAAKAVQDGGWLVEHRDVGIEGADWKSNELKLAIMSLDKVLKEAEHLL